MAFHEELIEHALFLAQLKWPEEPNQAELRRAISAAYYALFHLLTSEASLNWKNDSQRNRFARMFDHARMKTCSARVASRPMPTDPSQAKAFTDLKTVALAFVKLQQERHSADYDNSIVWSRKEVGALVSQAKAAMATWTAIRDEPLAQEFLFELIPSPNR